MLNGSFTQLLKSKSEKASPFKTNLRKYRKAIQNVASRLFGPVAAQRLIALVPLFTQQNYSIAHKLRKFRYHWAVTAMLNPKKMSKKLKHMDIIINSDHKKFYPIFFCPPYQGLFAIISTCFYHVSFAISKGYIPIIDLQNGQTAYIEEGKIGKENAWEYYLEQPYGYKLEDILYGTSEDLTSAELYRIPLDYDYRPIFEYWATLYGRFFKLSQSTQEHIDSEYARIINPDMKVLGVSCRGTDYTKYKPYGHAVQPELSVVLEKTCELMVKWKCTHIYIASEEREVVKNFQKSFPGKVLFSSCWFYDEQDKILDFGNPEKGIASTKFNRENDRFLCGLEYLTAIVILSKCNSIITSIANGGMAALYMNGGEYENRYVFDLGYYGVDERKQNETLK